MLKSATNAINAIPSLPESDEIASMSTGGIMVIFREMLVTQPVGLGCYGVAPLARLKGGVLAVSTGLE